MFVLFLEIEQFNKKLIENTIFHFDNFEFHFDEIEQFEREQEEEANKSKFNFPPNESKQLMINELNESNLSNVEMKFEDELNELESRSIIESKEQSKSKSDSAAQVSYGLGHGHRNEKNMEIEIEQQIRTIESNIQSIEEIQQINSEMKIEILTKQIEQSEVRIQPHQQIAQIQQQNHQQNLPDNIFSSSTQMITRDLDYDHPSIKQISSPADDHPSHQPIIDTQSQSIISCFSSSSTRCSDADTDTDPFTQCSSIPAIRSSALNSSCSYVHSSSVHIDSNQLHANIEREREYDEHQSGSVYESKSEQTNFNLISTSLSSSSSSSCSSTTIESKNINFNENENENKNELMISTPIPSESKFKSPTSICQCSTSPLNSPCLSACSSVPSEDEIENKNFDLSSSTSFPSESAISFVWKYFQAQPTTL
jgi:hypothetical protein